jgi:hypothetical protein
MDALWLRVGKQALRGAHTPSIVRILALAANRVQYLKEIDRQAADLNHASKHRAPYLTRRARYWLVTPSSDWTATTSLVDGPQ